MQVIDFEWNTPTVDAVMAAGPVEDGIGVDESLGCSESERLSGCGILAIKGSQLIVQGRIIFTELDG